MSSFIAATMPACWGFDTNAKLDAAAAGRMASAQWAGHSFKFVFRYVSLHAPSPADITADERDLILAAPLALGLVQHVNMPGWVAASAVGDQHGQAAVTHAISVAYPSGCHLGVDMEGIHDVGQPVLDYLEAWVKRAHDAGYKVVVYWGYAFVVDPAKVVALLSPGDIFWADYGPRVAPVGVGFVVKQHAQVTVAGVGIDPDEDFGTDQRGDALVLMKLSADENEGTADPAAGQDNQPAASAALN